MLDKWQNISACADLEGRAVEKERVSLHGGPPSAEPVQVVRLGPLTPPVLSIVTPLTVGAWAEALSSHLDQAFVEYLVDGICWVVMVARTVIGNSSQPIANRPLSERFSEQYPAHQMILTMKLRISLRTALPRTYPNSESVSPNQKSVSLNSKTEAEATAM